jgi:hypothetical protein
MAIRAAVPILRGVRSLAVVVLASVLCVPLARAQDGSTAPPETTTTEEAQRAQAAAHAQADSAAATTAPEEEDEHEAGLLDDADHPERSTAHQHTVVTADVFPETHRQTVPEEPEDDEELVLPPPFLEWRLRLGIGASAATAGGPQLSLRLLQEVEWMPHDVAPILFSLTGGELFGEYTLGLGAARVGLYGDFCQDRIVTCTGAIALRGGVIGGTTGVTFDIGGDGDARFRFDGVELAVRLGFFVIQSVTFVDAIGMVGAAF